MPQQQSNPQLSNLSKPTLDADQAHGFSDQFCILVAASDRAKDIFEITFQNADSIWRDVNWRRYVGFTTKHPDILGFKSLSAKSDVDWRGRVGDYLDNLPDEIRYVMLIIEDYLFISPINGMELNAVAEQICRRDLAYVRLVPVHRNLLAGIFEYLRRTMNKRSLRPLASWEPYYSSLEPAIWKRDYLRALVRQPGTVWEFEHIVSAERHYAVWRPVVRYVGIVAREKWHREAPRLLEQQGLSLGNSTRARQTVKFELRRIREKISFTMFGFLSFRIRRAFNRVPRT
ncbi:MAG: hypothetical protein WCD69_19510 [Xanthobacteraceae bacterium]